MEEDCIVCLCHLATDPTESPSTAAAPTADGTTTSDPNHASKPEDIPGVIGRLLPCGHHVHNDCLKPWVERANSCPICRTPFNEVQLCTVLSGPTISSYAVQDKIQVAEIDASLLVEDDVFEDGPAHPCFLCGEHGDEAELLLCESFACNNSCHVHCAGLSRVPRGPWHCQFCQQDGPEPSRHQRRARQARRNRRQDSTWNQIWHQVMNRANIDLDFPFDQEDPEDVARREARQREFRDWERRFAVADRQAGAAGRETASTILAVRGARDATPTANSREDGSHDEMRAWNAFDRANQLQEDARADTNSRKRPRSGATTPSEQQMSGVERQLKRPRPRRAQDIAIAGAHEVPSILEAGPSRTVPIVAPRPSARPGNAPTFLQSLLDEVQTAPTPNGQAQSPGNSTFPGLNMSNPGSPAGSPASSTPSSPRPRSISPGLTSRIEPAWYLQSSLHSGQPASPASPASPTSRTPKWRSATTPTPPSPTSSAPKSPNLQSIFSPTSPVSQDARALNGKLERTVSTPLTPADSDTVEDRRRLAGGFDEWKPSRNVEPELTHLSRSHDTDRASKERPLARAKESASPPELSRADKDEIRGFVKEHLKPLYNDQKIGRERYTEINRDITQRLYKLIHDQGGLDGERDNWRKMASKEVEKAVKPARAD